VPGKIKLPIAGEVNKKTAVIAGVAVVGVVGIAYIRHAKAAGSNAAAAGTAASAGGSETDPAGNVGVIDPQTGYVYGSPEDEQALANGSSQDASDLGAGYSDIGGEVYPTSDIDPATGYPYGSSQDLAALGGTTATGGTGTTATSTGAAPVSVAEWIANAENDLNAPSIAQIAPMVLAGIPISSAQKNVFLEAVAVEGQPPGGYPQPIKLTDSPAQGVTPAASVVVPEVKGLRAEDAGNKLKALGLIPHISQGVPPGKTGIINSQTPGPGKKVKKGSTVDLGVHIQ
jgi:hypothetical protein